MKIFVLIICLCALLISTACNDEQAEQYAKGLAQVLKTYQAEINRKIKAEQEAYKDLASTYAYAKQVEVTATLQTERIRRSGLLADALLQNGKSSLAEMQRLVAEQAKAEFDATRAMYEKEGDDQANYLTGIETLQIQSQNIAALIKALEGLGEAKGRAEQLKNFGNFAAEVKKKLDQLNCEDLMREIKCLEAEKAKAKELEDEAKEKKLAAQIKLLNEQFKKDQCSEDLRTKIKCQAE